MKITEDVRKYAAEQGLSDQQALETRNGTKGSRLHRCRLRNIREGMIDGKDQAGRILIHLVEGRITIHVTSTFSMGRIACLAVSRCPITSHSMIGFPLGRW